jgi:hypothetical protein
MFLCVENQYDFRFPAFHQFRVRTQNPSEMLNRTVLFMVAIAFTLIVTSGVNGIESNGAPIASTNAPGELTCNRSPCHTGSALNSGSGILTLNIANASGQYTPGATYDITVTMAQADILRFGFQTLALFDADSTNAGTFTVTDGFRTQVLSGINQYEGRQYMTYKYPGTEPFAAGTGQWSFQWTAPATAAGAVTFYTAAAAANNDGTDAGDLIYTQQLTLQPSASLAIGDEQHDGIIHRVFPNPASETVHLSYEVKHPGTTTVRLSDVLSRTSEVVLVRNDAPGTHQLTIELGQKYPAGLYFLTVSNGTSSDVRRFIIQ